MATFMEELSEVEKFRSECNQNPKDTQKLKKLADSLVSMVRTHPDNPESSKFLKDAETSYLQLLEFNSKDYDALLCLGIVYFYQKDDYKKDDKAYADLCNKAVNRFQEALKAKPGNFLAKDWLVTAWARLPREESSPQSPVRDEDGFRAQFRGMVAFEQDRQAAEAEFLKNPGDVDNLKKWGMALKMLAGYNEDHEEKQTLYEEAIDKLKKASALNPEDNELQLEWMKTCLQTRFRKGDEDTEYDELNERYKTLLEASKSAASLPVMSDKALSVNEYEAEAVEEKKISKKRKREKEKAHQQVKTTMCNNLK